MLFMPFNNLVPGKPKEKLVGLSSAACSEEAKAASLVLSWRGLAMNAARYLRSVHIEFDFFRGRSAAARCVQSAACATVRRLDPAARVQTTHPTF